MKLTFVGKTTTENTCNRCGRKHLAKTVAFRTEDGSMVYYGVGCANKAVNPNFGKQLNLYTKIENKIALIGGYVATGSVESSMKSLIARIEMCFPGVRASSLNGKLVVDGVGEFSIPWGA